MSLFTSGTWVVEPGREDDFAAAWARFADWTVNHVPGGPWAKLLRSRDQPTRFLSFGPWSDLDAISAWRGTPEFQAFVHEVRPMLTSFEPGVFDEVAAAEA